MRNLLVIVLIALVAWVLFRAIRYVRKVRYFASDEFVAHTVAIAVVVAEHNDISRYTAELRAGGAFDLGASTSGSHAHLASFQNTSQWNYRRDRNVPQYRAANVHNCSLQVVRNASADPLKYVMKYFGIKADEATLANVERISESIDRLEAAVVNLHGRELSIVESINPPRFVRRHYEFELLQRVGIELAPTRVPYPVYQFQYVSAGGNSSQCTVVELDTPTLDALIETLGQKIRWRKSAAGQRALMTANLREAIKQRDGYACRRCSISVAAEPHLLLEIDHIVPVSRGGLSTPENLQTLCWRCNRTKANRRV